MVPVFLKKLMFNLSKLPNIGTKTAAKLTLFLAENPQLIKDMLENLQNTLENTEICQNCFSYKEKKSICEYCEAPHRDFTKVCVVETAHDVLNIEKSGFNGVYHVLQGIVSPMNEIDIQDLKFSELKKRIQKKGIKELIFALSPSVEAEATILELTEELKPLGVEISTLAQGVPSGFGIEYLDQYTLQRAIEERRKL